MVFSVGGAHLSNVEDLIAERHISDVWAYHIQREVPNADIPLG
jgi:hypothetical protein